MSHFVCVRSSRGFPKYVGSLVLLPGDLSFWGQALALGFFVLFFFNSSQETDKGSEH